MERKRQRREKEGQKRDFSNHFIFCDVQVKRTVTTTLPPIRVSAFCFLFLNRFT